MTNSKKLQTALYDLNLDGLTGDTFSLAHDARLAHELLAENGQLVSRIHEMREVILKAHELVGFILSAAEDQVSINLELGQTHEDRERRKVQLLGFIRRNLDQVIDRAEPFMAAAAPFLQEEED